jgi:hypothetical protein
MYGFSGGIDGGWRNGKSGGKPLLFYFGANKGIL